MSVSIYCGDCLAWLKGQPTDSVDLVMTSPPYEAARTYGIGFRLKGQAWVDWAVEIFVECCRVSRGLVCWIVDGQTRGYQYSMTPMLMMADLHRAGVNLRKPPLYLRWGVSGSGGPDWFRNRYEFCICATPPGRLKWSNNLAMGSPPKFGPGGNPTHRQADGSRVNGKDYRPPKIANPGNLIDCGAGGGGHLGSAIAHESEAPFPEFLCEWFIKSYCPPGGVVLDPFCGSGTTLAVAVLHGRSAVGIDLRSSQCELSHRRVAEARQRLAATIKGSKSA